MKSKRKRIILGVVGVPVVAYLALAFTFMWPPMYEDPFPFCVNNLRAIDSGKEQAAMAGNWQDGFDCDIPSNMAKVNLYIRDDMLTCPSRGAYTYGLIGEDPTCSTAAFTNRSADGKERLSLFRWRWRSTPSYGTDRHTFDGQ